MDVPAPLVSFVKDFGPPLALAGDAAGVVFCCIAIGKMTGAIPDDETKILAKLETVAAAVAASTKQIIDRINQVQDVELLGDVAAQVANLRDYKKGSDDFKNGLTPLMVTKANENEGKLRKVAGYGYPQACYPLSAFH